MASKAEYFKDKQICCRMQVKRERFCLTLNALVREGKKSHKLYENDAIVEIQKHNLMLMPGKAAARSRPN